MRWSPNTTYHGIYLMKKHARNRFEKGRGYCFSDCSQVGITQTHVWIVTEHTESSRPNKVISYSRKKNGAARGATAVDTCRLATLACPQPFHSYQAKESSTREHGTRGLHPAQRDARLQGCAREAICSDRPSAKKNAFSVYCKHHLRVRIIITSTTSLEIPISSAIAEALKAANVSSNSFTASVVSTCATSKSERRASAWTVSTRQGEKYSDAIE